MASVKQGYAMLLVLTSIALSGCLSKSQKDLDGSDTSKSESSSPSIASVSQHLDSTDKPVDGANPMEKLQSKKDIVELTGRIVHNEFEGGFYGFIAQDGSKYTPSGLAKEHRRHGLIVKLSGQIMHDVMTTTQFGQTIRVQQISIVDDSNVSKPIIDKDDI